MCSRISPRGVATENAELYIDRFGRLRHSNSGPLTSEATVAARRLFPSRTERPPYDAVVSSNCKGRSLRADYFTFRPHSIPLALPNSDSGSPAQAPTSVEFLGVDARGDHTLSRGRPRMLRIARARLSLLAAAAAASHLVEANSLIRLT